MLKNKTYLKVTTVILILLPIISSCQIDSLKVIDDLKKNVKNKLSDSLLVVNGKVLASGNFNLIKNASKAPRLDYRIAANIQIQYKGLKIPLQYNYSNGRTLSTLRGPNIRTPSFSNLGLSPQKGDFTFHLGNRTMNFSKYSYGGVRFKGYGMEYKPKSIYFAFFKGNIDYINPEDQVYFSKQNSPFERNSWGSKLAYIKDSFQTGIVLFKATDNEAVDSLLALNNTKKENVSIELNTTVNIGENLVFHGSRTLSALTHNTSLKRTDIKTHSSIYNLLGLFEKNTSSIYSYASHLNLTYSLEKMSFGIDYEDIDPKYRSLGTNFYDNNYIAITSQNTYLPNEKINFSLNYGLRKTKLIYGTESQEYNLILNPRITLLYQKSNSVVVSFSNLRNTNKTYHINNQTFEPDSLSLSQSRNNFNITNSVSIGEEKKSNITSFVTIQKGVGIQSDSINIENEVSNITFGSTYSKSSDKHTLSTSANYITSKSSLLNSTIITVSISEDFSYSEVNSLAFSLQFNQLNSQNESSPQLVSQLEHNMKITNAFDFSQTIELRASDKSQSFNITDVFVGVDLNYKLNYRQNLKMNYKNNPIFE